MKLRNIKKLKPLLVKLNACEEAVKWVGNRDLHAAFKDCERADWMLWFFGRMVDKKGYPTHQDVVKMACLCARTSLKHVPEGKKQPLKAIEAAERWADNPTEENKQAAAEAAEAAGAAWAAARAAAKSAEAAAWAAAKSAEAAAWAAAEAAGAARSAAGAVEAAAGAVEAAAWAAGHKTLCNIIRKYVEEKEE